MQQHRAVLAAIAGVVTYTSTLAPAATWVPSTGNWGTAANWTPADVPDTAAETATLTTGTATVDANYTIGTLALDGGTVAGTFTLTTAVLAWTRGQMSAAGTTTVTGNATLTVPTNDYLYLTTRTLNLQGATAFGYAGPNYASLFLQGGAVVNSSGTFTIGDDSSVISSGSGNAFNNSGTLTKSGGTGTSNVAVFTNTGTVNANSGTLALSLISGGTSTGAFNTAAGKTLDLSANGTHTFTSTATFSGSGVRLSSGTLSASGTVAAAAGSSVTLDGATLAGTGAWQFANLVWTRGGMTASGTTTVTGNATLTIPTNDYLYVTTRTLNLQGATAFGYAGPNYASLFLQGGGVVNNSGTFTIGDDSNVITSGSGNAFNNSGTVTKSGGTGTSNVAAFTNTGTVNANSGTLALGLQGGGTSTGNFNVAAGAILDLGGNGTHTITSTAGFGGSGTLRFSSGTFDVQGARTVGHPVAITGGDVNFNAATTLGSLPLGGGTLGGTGLVTATSLTWTRGTMNDSGTTTVTGNATLTVPTNDYLYLTTRTLNLQGATAFGYAGPNYASLFLQGGAVVNSSGTFTIGDDSSVISSGSGNAFNNSGTLTKSGGTGTSNVAVFTNTGTVNANSGTLALSLVNGGTSTGAFNTAAGKTLDLSANGTHTFTSTATFSGSGVRLSSGTLSASGTVAAAAGSSVTLDGATLAGTGAWQFANLVWTRGGMTASGTTTVTGNAALTIPTNDYLYVTTRTLNLQGATAFGYAGPNYASLFLQGGGVVNNSGTFTIGDDSNVITSGSGNAFNNSGTVTKSGGTGTSNVAAFTNTGTVNANSGTLALGLQGGGTSTGNFNVAAGAVLDLGGNGTHTLSSTAGLTGSGALRVSAGTIDLQGARTITLPVSLTGGTLRIGTVIDTFSSLSISGSGRFDVGTGVVFVNNGGGAANLAAAKALVISGRTGGTGYFSASSDADHRVGYGDTGTAIKVRYTFNGDADLDGGVGIGDFNALAGNFGKGTGQVWAGGDFDYDGGVGINDFNLLAGQFGKSLAAPGATEGPAPASTADFTGLLAFAAAHDDLAAFQAVTGVPEPTSVTALAAGAMIALRRRRAMT